MTTLRNDTGAEVAASSPRINDQLTTAQITEPLKAIATRSYGQLVRPRGWESKLDGEIARELVKQIGVDCWDGKHAMLRRVHDILTARNPDTSISIRRVRGMWHGECASVAFSEVIELAAAAAYVQEVARER